MSSWDAVVCEVCGAVSRATVRHHDDYAKPDVTRVMCRKCHGAWHRDNVPLHMELRVPTKTELTPVSVYLPIEQAETLRAMARAEHRSVSRMLALLVEGALGGAGGEALASSGRLPVPPSVAGAGPGVLLPDGAGRTPPPERVSGGGDATPVFRSGPVGGGGAAGASLPPDPCPMSPPRGTVCKSCGKKH